MDPFGKWAEEVFSDLDLSENSLRYCLSRGATKPLLASLKVKTWSPCPSNPCPDSGFVSKYGEAGKSLAERLVIPYYSPWGEITGFECRRTDFKYLSDVRSSIPLRGCPFFLGLNPFYMQRIWDNSRVWLVEGFFDLVALRWVVPEGDVVLATVTAKLGKEQLRFLSRFVRNSKIFIVYDNDAPGKRGSLKAKENFKFLNINCEIVKYKGGKDPGEIWDKGGERALKEAFWHLIRDSYV